MKKILGAAILTVLSPLACSAELLDARSVLAQIEGAAESARRSDSAQLLADIQQFRKQYRQLAPRTAAERWFEHLDRAQALPRTNMSFDAAGFDPDISQIVSVRSVLASIPAPPTWPAMRDIALVRAKNARSSDIDALAILLLTHVLNDEAAGIKATLAKMEAAIHQLAPEMRAQMMDALLSARLKVASVYGTPADVVSAFEARLNSIEGGDSAALQVPDLVGMLGAERATPLLLRAVTSSAVVDVQRSI